MERIFTATCGKNDKCKKWLNWKYYLSEQSIGYGVVNISSAVNSGSQPKVFGYPIF